LLQSLSHFNLIQSLNTTVLRSLNLVLCQLPPVIFISKLVDTVTARNSAVFNHVFLSIWSYNFWGWKSSIKSSWIWHCARSFRGYFREAKFTGRRRR
jgi:hypothetical protein